MKTMANEHCVPINSTSIQLTDFEVKQLQTKISGWTMVNIDGEPRLEKTYKFKDFKQAMMFTNKVAHEADQEDHHPAILTEWAKVKVTWWTHKINGLHLNDFIMAEKSDHLYAEGFVK